MDDELDEIERILSSAPDGLALSEIAERLTPNLTPRQIRYRLGILAARDRIRVEGERRWTRYFPVDVERRSPSIEATDEIFGTESRELLRAIRRPPANRDPVGYRDSLLDGYRPGETFLLGERLRQRLRSIGVTARTEAPAGTYARQIMERLMIDLSWASSHLEGNTYSLLDTRRLIEQGEAAEGKELLETQMILNHKRAIEFLVEDVAEVGPRASVIRNLHATLMDNLLADPGQAGAIRTKPVRIGSSTYAPISNPQRLNEAFHWMLALARSIDEPLEQSFFLFVHVAYLQAFIDGNKRTARLAANIPLIRENFRPLTFVDVPRDDYLRATLVWYETTEIGPLRELYSWAYERSCARYETLADDAVGEPDRFRLSHRSEIYAAVRAAVTSASEDPEPVVEELAEQHFDDVVDRARFVGIVMTDLEALHEGNFMRYRIKPAQFETWRKRASTTPE